MQPDWDYVKKTTLWQYEELIQKIAFTRSYPVIWRSYNHDMTQAAAYARRLFPERDIEAGAYPAKILRVIEQLRVAGVADWGSLISSVDTKDALLAFIEENDVSFEAFIDMLHYLLRWAFPFQTASRELLNYEDPQEMAHYEVLKQHKLMKSFDLLEQGHTPSGREILAERTGLPLTFVTDIVHRADIVRLPYVRRKTLIPVRGAGYDTLAKIAGADPGQMQADLDAYLRREKGKTWENYQAVIAIKGMVTAAQALPAILEG